MEEIFKDIPGYEGIYQVSNLGEIKSLSRVRFNGMGYCLTKDKLLKKSISQQGYYYVTLCIDKNKKNFNVHQLVAMAFLNHIPCGFNLVVDHINDNPLDNRLENLQVVTQRFNSHKKQEGYSCNIKGLYFNNKSNKYQSYITINNKVFHLGFYSCEKKAEQLRDYFSNNYLTKINKNTSISEVKEIIEIYKAKIKTLK